MTAKTNPGRLAPDNATYGCWTNGLGSLVVSTNHNTSGTKKSGGIYAPDGSTYLTITDGSGNV